uniref:Cystathionine gamma-lyase n=1 Tax=Eptatretus burgeri TaxID=7764 RepID=A0A8C4QBU3_EPTBU
MTSQSVVPSFRKRVIYGPSKSLCQLSRALHQLYTSRSNSVHLYDPLNNPPCVSNYSDRSIPTVPTMSRSHGFATLAMHAGQDAEQWRSCAVVPPISLATTFKQHAPGQHEGYEYSRSGNPTRKCLEEAVAAVDGAKYGTNRYFQQVVRNFGVEISFVDCTNMENVKAAMRPTTKLVWVETPSNPMMEVTDIEACASVVHSASTAFLVVDNTFMSPYFQRPLALGADVCMNSATKYINGHSDVVMGLLSTNRKDLYDRFKFLQNALGCVPSPFDCFLCNRGLKTLPLRMKQHQASGLAVAKFLTTHRYVQKVLHPAFEDHPQYEISARQTSGSSGMLSLYLKGGLEQATAFLSNLKIFTLAESLGGYESLAEHPAIMTHASIPEAERVALGITGSLVRLSVGLEDEEDLIADLDNALNAAFSEKKDQ